MQVRQQTIKPLGNNIMRKQLDQICSSKDLKSLLEEGGSPVEFLEVVVEVAGGGVKVSHFEEVDVVL